MGLLILTESKNVAEEWQFNFQVIRARRTLRIIWPDELCLLHAKKILLSPWSVSSVFTAIREANATLGMTEGETENKWEDNMQPLQTTLKLFGIQKSWRRAVRRAGSMEQLLWEKKWDWSPSVKGIWGKKEKWWGLIMWTGSKFSPKKEPQYTKW